jgi:hypothetical protein
MLRVNPCGSFNEETIKEVIMKDYNKIEHDIKELIECDCDDADDLQLRTDKLTKLLKRLKFIEPITEMADFNDLDERCYAFIEKQKIKLMN